MYSYLCIHVSIYLLLSWFSSIITSKEESIGDAYQMSEFIYSSRNIGAIWPLLSLSISLSLYLSLSLSFTAIRPVFLSLFFSIFSLSSTLTYTLQFGFLLGLVTAFRWHWMIRICAFNDDTWSFWFVVPAIYFTILGGRTSTTWITIARGWNLTLPHLSSFLEFVFCWKMGSFYLEIWLWL